MTAHAEHRPYLGAIADGELSAVPAATLGHVRDCPECSHEVELQRLIGGRLREALVAPPPRRAWNRRWTAAAAGAAAALILAAGGTLAFNLLRPDPVLAAATVSQQPAQFRSTDGHQVGAWCVQQSGRALPEMDLPPLQPVGARMDHQAGTGIVTVFYLDPDGQPVAVSWLDADVAPMESRGVSSRVIGGRLVLVAHSAHGTAVITGRVPDSMLWATAAEVEDGG